MSKRITAFILPTLLFGIALTVYCLSALVFERFLSPDSAYFHLLAESFLHGRLDLPNPPSQSDLTQYAGKWFVAFPPLPALLMLPWVALFGAAHTNTVLFSAIIGAVNVALTFLLLEALAQRDWTQLKRADNLWLTLLLGLGTVHWYMATLGSVWFVSQLCTLTFMLLATWIAVDIGSPLFSGGALAVAMLARPNVALAYPLLVAIGMQKLRESQTHFAPRRLIRWAGVCFAPLLVSGVLLLGYNAARFNNPFDFGYLNQNVSAELIGDLHTYGQFNFHYVSHNIWAMLLSGPNWNAARHQILPDLGGMSLLLTTPALIYIFNLQRFSMLALGACLATVLLMIPLLTYYNTGWWQFGYRFSLDFMTPVMILLALGARTRVSWKLRVLILLGVIVNAWGVWWFLNPHVFPFNQF